MFKVLSIIAAFAASITAAAPAIAGPAEDAAAAVTGILDKFNGGDIGAFASAHRDGAIIIDEFPPFVWGGPGSVKNWGADYMKDATARGIAAGRIDYQQPIQATSDGTSAYVVLPTVYRFTQKGAKMAGKGSMTFVMTRVGPDWKISSWTYSGATPVPD